MRYYVLWNIFCLVSYRCLISILISIHWLWFSYKWAIRFWIVGSKTTNIIDKLLTFSFNKNLFPISFTEIGWITLGLIWRLFYHNIGSWKLKLLVHVMMQLIMIIKNHVVAYGSVLRFHDIFLFIWMIHQCFFLLLILVLN